MQLPVLCISLYCATSCVVHLPVLWNSLCCASPYVVHVAALCTLLRRKLRHARGSSAPPDPPEDIKTRGRCASPCVVQLPVLCNSLCCATPCVVPLKKSLFPFSSSSSLFPVPIGGSYISSCPILGRMTNSKKLSKKTGLCETRETRESTHPLASLASLASPPPLASLASHTHTHTHTHTHNRLRPFQFLDSRLHH